MNRALILSIAYYPAEVPGTFRVASFARWLPEYGYSVRVLAPGWTKENSRSLPFISDALADAIPDERKAEIVNFSATPSMFIDGRGRYPAFNLPGNTDFIGKMTQAGRHLYQEAPFDVILTTAPPHVSMLMAADRLSRALGVPWIADKRDIVSQWPEKRGPGLRGTAEFFVRKFLRVRNRLIAAETRLCNRAFVATAVSDSLAERLRLQGVRSVDVIYNGYEEEDFKVPPIRAKKFTVQYFGRLREECDAGPLFNAVDALLRNGLVDPADFTIVFRGLFSVDFVDSQVQKRPCEAVIQAKRQVPKQEAVARMKGSHVLLHLSFRGTKGILTSKLTEYLAAGVPILSVPGDGDVVDRFLKETGAGVSSDDPDAIAHYLLQHYQAWKRGETIANRVNPAVKEFYTRRKQAEKMARLLDAAIASNQTP